MRSYMFSLLPQIQIPVLLAAIDVHYHPVERLECCFQAFRLCRTESVFVAQRTGNDANSIPVAIPLSMRVQRKSVPGLKDAATTLLKDVEIAASNSDLAK